MVHLTPQIGRLNDFTTSEKMDISGVCICSLPMKEFNWMAAGKREQSVSLLRFIFNQ